MVKEITSPHKRRPGTRGASKLAAQGGRTVALARLVGTSTLHWTAHEPAGTASLRWAPPAAKLSLRIPSVALSALEPVNHPRTHLPWPSYLPTMVPHIETFLPAYTQIFPSETLLWGPPHLDVERKTSLEPKHRLRDAADWLLLHCNWAQEVDY